MQHSPETPSRDVNVGEHGAQVGIVKFMKNRSQTPSP